MSIDQGTGLLDRFCIRCSEKLGPERQRNTCFHNHACKQAWYRAKQATHASEDLLYTEQQFRHCRKRAHWYRLAILIDKAVWMYPPVGRPSLRFDGLQRSTPGFRIEPYEPPVVPIKGRYSVFLFDAQGQAVSSIEACRQIRAEPLWQVSVESGDPRSE
jgi:hypothetical protein